MLLWFPGSHVRLACKRGSLARLQVGLICEVHGLCLLQRIASVAGVAAYGADGGADDDEENDEEEAKAKAMEAGKVVTPLQAAM